MDDHEMKIAFAKTASGDIEAFGPIGSTLRPALLRFVNSIVKDVEVADDLVQDTNLKAIEKANTFRGDASVKTWIFTIARNLAYAHLKKQKRQHQIMSLPLLAAGAGWGQYSDPERIASIKEESRILHEALSALDPESREIILLRDIEGYSGNETSEIIELSLGATKTKLHRARLKLLAELKRRLE